MRWKLIGSALAVATFGISQPPIFNEITTGTLIGTTQDGKRIIIEVKKPQFCSGTRSFLAKDAVIENIPPEGSEVRVYFRGGETCDLEEPIVIRLEVIGNEGKK